ncbi:MAG: hypothetical protein LBI53_08055 [Candidatus Peribacteria bacterium]|jgi:hypothetical protein|nr:hypothetical protein [Candidatus Peribacteria bacterium]
MEHLAPLIHQILSRFPNLSPDQLKDMQRAFAKQQKMKTLPSKSQMLQTYFSLLKT